MSREARHNFVLTDYLKIHKVFTVKWSEILPVWPAHHCPLRQLHCTIALKCLWPYFAILWQACSIWQMRAACNQLVQRNVFRFWVDIIFSHSLLRALWSSKELSTITLYLWLVVTWLSCRWCCYRTKMGFLWTEMKAVCEGDKIQIPFWQMGRRTEGLRTCPPESH